MALALGARYPGFESQAHEFCGISLVVKPDSSKVKSSFRLRHPAPFYACVAQLVERSICNRVVVGSSPTSGSTLMGVKGFDLITNLKMHAEVDRWPRKKSVKKLRADNTDSILAEAEYIFNNADEFVGAEEDMLLAA